MFRARESVAALAMRRVRRNRRIFLMHLANRRHRRESNGYSEGENEREKCQTWSHCKTSFWNQKTNAIDYSRIIVDWSRSFRDRSHTQIREKETGTKTRSSGILLLADAIHNRRDFAIKPVLLVRERRPSLRHARIALVGGLSFGALGELQAVVGVIPENVRLLHE